MNLKERLAGTLLLCAIVPMAVVGYLLIVVVGLFGKVNRVRQGPFRQRHTLQRLCVGVPLFPCLEGQRETLGKDSHKNH